VLMLTTAGPTCLAICEKPLERVAAAGMTRGFASEVLTAACSLPLTELVMTEPAMMPAESVARSAKVVPRPWLRRRESQVGDVLIGVSIGRSDLFRLLPAARSWGLRAKY